MAVWVVSFLTVTSTTGGGGAAHAPSEHPTHDEVKGGAYWRQLAACARTDDDALASIKRGLAADRRHLYAWRWLLKLVVRHVRATGGRWPEHILPAPAHWAESDNGSFWHLRAVVLAEQLRLLPGEDERRAALEAELALVWRGHWKQGASEARWTYHRHLLELLCARGAPLNDERERMRAFVDAHPELAAVVRYAICALRPGAGGAGGTAGADYARLDAWLELVDALADADAPRARLYADLAADGERQAGEELGPEPVSAAGEVEDAEIEACESNSD